MKLNFIFFFAILIIGCTTKEPAPIEEPAPVVEQEICIPPFAAVDTSTVRMQMKLDGIFYQPLSNFNCIMPNIFLGVNQLWINGGTFFATRVVTLIMPPDIQPGNYPILQNSLYDLRYVPTDNINYLPIQGTLHIGSHDMTNHHIEGGFKCLTQCFSCPNQNTVDITEGCFSADY
jgi:hypothetical protein